MEEQGLVIGLCGYAGSGKDCAAIGLTDCGWSRISFADGIRDVLRQIDPLVTMAGGYRLNALVAEEGWDGAKKNPDVRRLLQTTGTALRDVVSPDVWVEVAESKLMASGTKNVVFTDVRFPSEIELLREYSGTLVRIVRPGVGPVNGHISETAIDDIPADYTIENDGSPEALQAKLAALAEEIASYANDIDD